MFPGGPTETNIELLFRGHVYIDKEHWNFDDELLLILGNTIENSNSCNKKIIKTQNLPYLNK